MTPEQIEQERIAFEAWYIKYGNHTEQDKCLYLGRNPNTNMYTIPHIQDMWRGWLARAKQTGWISVEDKLPEADAIVLAVVRNNPEVGLFSLVDFGDDGLRWSIVTIEGVCPVDDLRITHWQPLPQPPAGGAK